MFFTSTFYGLVSLWEYFHIKTLTYKYWFCGHYHTNKRVDRLQMLFEDFKEWPSLEITGTQEE